MTAEHPEAAAAHRQWRNRLAIALGIVAVLAIVLLGFLAFAGGLRLRTPLERMEATLGEFGAPRGVLLDRTETAGEHVCFLQCIEWRVDRFFEVTDRKGGPVDDQALCEELRAATEAWAGKEVNGGLAETPPAEQQYVCGYQVRGLPADPTWCGRVLLLSPSRSDDLRAGVQVTVGIEC